jgi:hypothetical protein
MVRKDPYAPETRISLELLKRSLDGGHIASASIDEVYGPILERLEAEPNPSMESVHTLLSDWLNVWQEVRRLCDAYMKRNREYFDVRPHANLSPILLEFENRLVDVVEDDELDARGAIERIREACDLLNEELDGFYEWAHEVGGPIGIDYEDATEKSIRRAGRFWLPNVRAMEKMMQDAGA